MTAYCPKCNDEIAEDQVVLVEATTFCRDHAATTTILDYARWRDMPTGDTAYDREQARERAQVTEGPPKRQIWKGFDECHPSTPGLEA